MSTLINNISFNLLSGSMQTTGRSLSSSLSILSGNLYQTGNILINTFRSGVTTGVASVNSSTGNITLTGAGNITVISNGANTIISGSTGDYSALATKNDLYQTGHNLYNMMVGLSGAVSVSFQTLIFSGNPEGVVTASSGSLGIDWFGQKLYLKVTGTAAYGWV